MLEVISKNKSTIGIDSINIGKPFLALYQERYHLLYSNYGVGWFWLNLHTREKSAIFHTRDLDNIFDILRCAKNLGAVIYQFDSNAELYNYLSTCRIQ